MIKVQAQRNTDYLNWTKYFPCDRHSLRQCCWPRHPWNSVSWKINPHRLKASHMACRHETAASPRLTVVTSLGEGARVLITALAIGQVHTGVTTLYRCGRARSAGVESTRSRSWRRTWNWWASSTRHLRRVSRNVTRKRSMTSPTRSNSSTDSAISM